MNYKVLGLENSSEYDVWLVDKEGNEYYFEDDTDRLESYGELFLKLFRYCNNEIRIVISSDKKILYEFVRNGNKILLNGYGDTSIRNMYNRYISFIRDFYEKIDDPTVSDCNSIWKVFDNIGLDSDEFCRIVDKVDNESDWNWNVGTKTTDIDGFKIELKEYTSHITGFDDLGYPTSFCVTAKRSITPSDKTDLYIVQNQTIISETSLVYYDNKDANGTRTYYEKCKTKNSDKWQDFDYNLLPQPQDKLKNESQDIKKINGNEYIFVNNSEEFLKVVNKNVAIHTEEINGYNFKEMSDLGYKFKVENLSATGITTTGEESIDDKISIISGDLPESSFEENKATLQITYLAKDLSDDDYKNLKFNYQIRAYKDDETQSILLDTTNVIIDGNNINIKTDAEGLIDDNIYIIKFTKDGESNIFFGTYKDKKITVSVSDSDKDKTLIANLYDRNM